MIEIQGTWGQVEVGTTMLTKTGLPVVVIRKEPDAKGRFWYLLHDCNKHKMRVTPKPPDRPVTLLECTPEEAEQYAKMGLGAERILDFEKEARMEERAKQWLVPPVPTKGTGALNKVRDHIQWYHGTYAGSAENGGFKSLKQILAAHEEMHEAVFMDRPHTHKEA